MLWKTIQFFFDNRFITLFMAIILLLASLMVSPFNWRPDFLPSDPVLVDAIPDIGENQQIVFTAWEGRSPQDIEDQITYPLTATLLGIPGVKSVRSSSIFGMSSIYIIFEEDIEFYWSRTRILEKLSSLPQNALPQGVTPSLGPDASALGQVFWYSIEGRDGNGNPTGGWDLHELRAVQDFQVRYALSSVAGVSEVSSIGGYVQEYQVDVNPDALRNYEISLQTVISVIRESNRDIGAKTIEINKAEYIIRGLGTIQSTEDIENAVLVVRDQVPIRIKDIGVVGLGPASRRGLLDKEGAEVVGGVVVARYGANPVTVIQGVKQQLEKMSGGLPKKILANGVESQLTIVPFYDRSQLIQQTLGTLEEALIVELMITILVVLVLIRRIRISFLVSGLLPLSVLAVFLAMKYWGVDANIVSLSGIAIAIGTMVDLAIILTENILVHLDSKQDEQEARESILKATREVFSPMLVSVATTIVSFTPIFLMENAEGKLFHPLAFSKTMALLGALLITLCFVPSAADVLLRFRSEGAYRRSKSISTRIHSGFIGLGIILLSVCLARVWMPLGGDFSIWMNIIFVGLIVFVILGGFYLLRLKYAVLLDWCLRHRKRFLVIPSIFLLWGLLSWFGFSSLFSPIEKGCDKIGVNIRTNPVWSAGIHAFPGLGNEFMPSLDEGAFLLMPTSMPHSGIAQNKEIVQQLDMILASIPEVELAVGKIGRVESALDPAPISMVETIINIKPEFVLDEHGARARFSINDQGDFLLQSGEYRSFNDILREKISEKQLVPDGQGVFFRNWRPEILSSDDIWQEIVSRTKIPGVTSAPKLQPIETRLVMLQTGMRAPMGLKVFGTDLDSIEQFSRQVERALKRVPSIKKETVFADRIVGKPYLLLKIDREAIGRYGVTIEDIQQSIQVAVGGIQLTATIEGRKRFPVRVRYPRELRDDPSQLDRILIATPIGVQVPLSELVVLEYTKGPQMIRSEDGFLVGYVLFDKNPGMAAGDVVEEAKRWLDLEIKKKEIEVPEGIRYTFSGSYENQRRAHQRLRLIIPLVFISIALILYSQFRSIAMVSIIGTGVGLAFSGGFILIWLYGLEGMSGLSLLGLPIGAIFQLKTINLSVGVWVGFIALFGIATDDGVLMGTFLEQKMREERPLSRGNIRQTIINGAVRRVRPATMTSATTLIALLPILTSTGRGADIMIPMAIPAFGGMLLASISYFLVPVLYSFWAERIFLGEKR